MITREAFLTIFLAPVDTLVPGGGTWMRGPGIISDLCKGEIEWWFREQKAEIVSEIDFGCGFQNGRCQLEIEKPELQGEINYCCNTCNTTIGNLLEISPTYIDVMSDLFNVDTGFWRKNHGCILPARYRSTQCLIDRCGYRRLPEEDLLKIYELVNIKQAWRKRCP